MLVPSIVFTKVKKEFSDEIKKHYKMTEDNFSTVNSLNTDAVFPFVFLRSLSSSEYGQDLEGLTVNAALFSFQVDVYDNRTQDRTRQVMGEVMRIMKSMRFEVIAMPEFDSESNEHRCTARFRRLIGSGDVL